MIIIKTLTVKVTKYMYTKNQLQKYFSLNNYYKNKYLFYFLTKS